jgi:hypothetical protein
MLGILWRSRPDLVDVGPRARLAMFATGASVARPPISSPTWRPEPGEWWSRLTSANNGAAESLAQSVTSLVT